ncbi:metal ABC transporter substrate-binding protein [Lyngbya confervoides]|uniref:Metal ABC transporter substrate-binding protein n=1 Tax=Lyngbya confervoides BDU141951 TaxID=1574623 RepID=A0ABD4T0X1_9CYAN|nr:metal ABC transporter substrate-binding protein [Lyngbya confervoides]MCM1982352.1 metal ABC transporter substrate-binding protein [Lyngbya confervoides BDU141951]
MNRLFSMHRRAAGVLGCILLGACGNSSLSSAPDPAQSGQIVATHAVLCDLAQQLLQDPKRLTCLMQAGEDAHSYQPTPQDRQALETASLILYNGYDFEAGMGKLLQSTKVATVAVAEQAVPNPREGQSHDHADPHSTDSHSHSGSQGEADPHDHGDHDLDISDQNRPESEASPQTQGDSGSPQADNDVQADPHVWHNPQHGIKMVAVIATALGDLDPERRADYQQREAAIAQDLQEIDRWIQAQVQTIPTDQRVIWSTHESLGYFGEAYGLSVEGILTGLNPDQKPAAAKLKAVVDELRQTKAPTLFAELGEPSPLLQSVAKDAGKTLAANPLITDGLNQPGRPGDTYKAMLVYNTRNIVTELGGTIRGEIQDLK